MCFPGSLPGKKGAENNDGCREIRMLTKFFCENEVHASWGRGTLKQKRLPVHAVSGDKFRGASQGREENEAQGFTQLDNRSKVVRVDGAIPPSEIAPTKQSKKRQI